MTTHRGVFRTVVGSTGCLIGLIFLIWPTGILQADTVVSLAWDANTEPDLAGYRIHYGTSPGSYTLPTITVVGQNNARTITNLQANTTYYFAVTAYDLAGNESPLSNEVAAQPTSTTLPTIVGALDLGTQSVYILQSGNQTIQVVGTNFQSGAVVGLGTDVSVGSTSLLDSSHLTASIIVSGWPFAHDSKTTETTHAGARRSCRRAAPGARPGLQRQGERRKRRDPLHLDLLHRLDRHTGGWGCLSPVAGELL